MSLLNSLVVKTLPFVPKPIVGHFSKRYIAGPALHDAMRVVSELNGRGIMGTVDVLGESITSLDQARAYAAEYVQVLEEIDRRRLDANISVKPTAMGLKLDTRFCLETVAGVVKRARELGSFVRLDMEDSSCTSDTIDLHDALRREYPNVGIVLQSCLRRSLADAVRLAAQGANFRICKGIYVEPRRIAWRDPEIINRSFVEMLDAMLAKGCYVGIATHDERLIFEGIRLTQAHGTSRERFEFQMLLGVEEELRSILVEAGYRLRVYVPFGREWYAYSVRRLKENPSLAGQTFKNVLRNLLPG